MQKQGADGIPTLRPGPPLREGNSRRVREVSTSRHGDEPCTRMNVVDLASNSRAARERKGQIRFSQAENPDLILLILALGSPEKIENRVKTQSRYAGLCTTPRVR